MKCLPAQLQWAQTWCYYPSVGQLEHQVRNQTLVWGPFPLLTSASHPIFDLLQWPLRCQIGAVSRREWTKIIRGALYQEFFSFFAGYFPGHSTSVHVNTLIYTTAANIKNVKRRMRSRKRQKRRKERQSGRETLEKREIWALEGEKKETEWDWQRGEICKERERIKGQFYHSTIRSRYNLKQEVPLSVYILQ